MPNLTQALRAEIERVREVMYRCQEHGPSGERNAGLMKSSIKEAEDSVAAGDQARMMKALTNLRRCRE